ncbi:MAG: helix-turn-helix transcriptional regulator, partial [Bacillota bacterium]|nr:helix-turn-helix transcriptional regulator [Bacillota bacterium]
GLLLLVLSLNGVFSRSEEELRNTLEVQHNNMVSSLQEQINILTAQGITLSGLSSDLLDNLLYTAPTADLNNDYETLEKLEKDLYGLLNTALRAAPCNGVYLVLDATTNTEAEGAEHSRAGIYLRFANLNSKTPVDQDVTLYRGIPRLARENNLELHNRWKMEFDISMIPLYKDFLQQELGRVADHCCWTRRAQLTDTWENMILLMVPICGSGNVVRGICGLELGDLYMRLSYPAQGSRFGNMLSVIAPMEKEQFFLAQGMTGGLDGSYLDKEDILHCQLGKNFNQYSGNSGSFLGLHTEIDMALVGGGSMYALTLIPEAGYNAASSTERVVWALGALAFLSLMLLLSFILSRCFVRPIAKSLAAIQSGPCKEMEETGISEIDCLLRLLHRKLQSTEDQLLPGDMAELFDAFAERAVQLTPAERNILCHYSEGREVAEVAELAFISINTVRKHNSNIYQKLGVGSRDELMLYLELFRRCDRLDEIFQPPLRNEDNK